MCKFNIFSVHFLKCKHINFSEYRIFKFQNFISYSYVYGQTIYLRNYQRLLLASLSSRLKVVRDLLYFCGPTPLKFTSLEKIVVLFSLNFDFYHYNCFPFFVSKKAGLSFFFPYVFFNSLGALANLSVLPVVEMFSDRSLYMYRPFRNCYDLVFCLKTYFRRNCGQVWFSNYEVENFSIFPGWLLKAFPLDKKILFFWISNYINNFGDYFCFTDHNFYFSILSCLFNGIVFVFKLILLALFSYYCYCYLVLFGFN